MSNESNFAAMTSAAHLGKPGFHPSVRAPPASVVGNFRPNKPEEWGLTSRGSEAARFRPLPGKSEQGLRTSVISCASQSKAGNAKRSTAESGHGRGTDSSQKAKTRASASARQQQQQQQQKQGVRLEEGFAGLAGLKAQLEREKSGVLRSRSGSDEPVSTGRRIASQEAQAPVQRDVANTRSPPGGSVRKDSKERRTGEIESRNLSSSDKRITSGGDSATGERRERKNGPKEARIINKDVYTPRASSRIGRSESLENSDSRQTIERRDGQQISDSRETIERRDGRQSSGSRETIERRVGRQNSDSRETVERRDGRQSSDPRETIERRDGRQDRKSTNQNPSTSRSSPNSKWVSAVDSAAKGGRERTEGRQEGAVLAEDPRAPWSSGDKKGAARMDSTTQESNESRGRWLSTSTTENVQSGGGSAASSSRGYESGEDSGKLTGEEVIEAMQRAAAVRDGGKSRRRRRKGRSGGSSSQGRSGSDSEDESSGQDPLPPLVFKAEWGARLRELENEMKTMRLLL